LAFDEAYARHGGATIASVLANAGPSDRIIIHILDNGISASSRNSLQECANRSGGQIVFIQFDLRQFSSFPTTQHAVSAYSRLALPEALPNLDQVIYLDSDLIVLKTLRPLWEKCLDGNAAAVVRDAADVFGSHFLDHKQKLGLTLDHPAFNSGVMLMNLKLWREQSVADATASWIRENAEIMVHSDQDALNAILKDDICFLNPEWNVQTGLIRAVRYGWINHPEWVAAVSNPAIIHYTTNAKPWDFTYAVPRRRDYSYFASLSTMERRPKKMPALGILLRRLGSEAMEFRWWLAALVKGRLRCLP
jgi:lipopolysaccharide biosynthesis glycosyltransferase